MHVAYIGIKGLPARGGAERVVEGLVARMPQFGVQPTVYCDHHYTPPEVRLNGIDLVRLPALSGKYARSTTLDLLAALHALFRGQYDLIHLHHVEAGFVLPLLRLRYRVVSTSHGAAYLRAKWGPFAKQLIRMMDVPFMRFSNAVTFVSAKDAREFKERYQQETIYIPNGVGIEYSPDQAGALQILRSHNLTQGRFFIFVAGRIDPTKGAHLAIEAINRLEAGFPLLMVGDLSHVPEYSRQLKDSAGPLVRFQPLIESRSTLFGLMSSATALVFPSLIEAMSMVLLESAAIGIPIICSDIPENREVMHDQAFYFDPGRVETLVEKLSWVLQNSEQARRVAAQAQRRIQAEYSWDTITSQYVELYHTVCRS